MLRSLPVYLEHLDENPNSMLAKIYGLFTVRMDQFEPIHVMIMQNSIPAVENTELQYVFDLKGSQINREVLKDLTDKDIKKRGPTGGKVLKDLDYVRMEKIKQFYNMSAQDNTRINRELQKDVKFLMGQKFMDYSLLLAVKKVVKPTVDDSFLNMTDDFLNQEMDLEHSPDVQNNPMATAMNQSEILEDDEFLQAQRAFSQHQSDLENKKEDIRDQAVFYSTCGKWCYQISIIDYLQTFDSGKKQEVLAKKLFKQVDTKKLSAVPSDPYGQRYLNFMKSYVIRKSMHGENKDEYLLKQVEHINQQLKQFLAEKLKAQMNMKLNNQSNKDDSKTPNILGKMMQKSQK